MTRLTSGPATVMAISCHGFSGIVRNAATPPMGSSVMLLTSTPSCCATTLCPNSCRTTQVNSEQTSANVHPAPATPPPA